MESMDKDPIDEYDAAKGHTTLKDEQRPANLSESANKAPPQAEAFKITRGE